MRGRCCGHAPLGYTQGILRWIFAILVIPCAFAQTPTDPAGDAALGKKLFESQCALCHGQDGSGGRGPNLRRKIDRAPDDAALRKLIWNGVQPEMPGAWQLSAREVASVAAFVETLGAVTVEPVPGDASRGERIYRSKGCANCHMIQGEGSGFGPELTEIGAKRNPAFLRESVVAPEASVPDGFLLIELVASDGRTIRGARLNEDSFSIQLKDAGGNLHSYRKSELKEVRKLRGKSSMPSYKQSLSEEELTDLTAYLAGLRWKS